MVAYENVMVIDVPPYTSKSGSAGEDEFKK